MCMGGGAAPAAAPLPAPTPPPPTQVDPAVLAARQDAASKANAATGLRADVATSAQGDLTSNANQKKTLLGV